MEREREGEIEEKRMEGERGGDRVRKRERDVWIKMTRILLFDLGNLAKV